MHHPDHSRKNSKYQEAILPAIAGLTLLGMTAKMAHAVTPPPIVNPLSAFPIEADGAYTNPGEWSDITPAWFISNAQTGASPTFPGDPAANSLLFAGLSRDTPTSPPELYLMYDYLPRTAAPTLGAFLGNVSFPVTITSNPIATSTPITVELHATTDPNRINTASFFDVFVDLHDGNGLGSHPELGLEAGVGLGITPDNPLWGVTVGSPFHNTLHELLELGVPLDIPAGFGSPGGPFDPKGQSGPDGGYSPDPAFWNSNLPKNPGDPDPPASGGLFSINPDGSTLIQPTFVPIETPEPASLGLLAIGTALLTFRRRAPRNPH